MAFGYGGGNVNDLISSLLEMKKMKDEQKMAEQQLALQKEQLALSASQGSGGGGGTYSPRIVGRQYDDQGNLMERIRKQGGGGLAFGVGGRPKTDTFGTPRTTYKGSADKQKAVKLRESMGR